MFARFKTGWGLAKQSLAVIRSDRELLLFPLISSIALFIVSASFLVPVMASDSVRQFMESDTASHDPVVYIVAFLFYFINYFIIMFFNAGLIGCAIIRFDGGNPTLADGFRTSMECLPQIFGWSLVSATVGMIIKVIESRSERVGQIVSAIIGLAWNVTTYFVLPILVVEKVGPFEAISRSTDILKKTWGEALSANIGIGIFLFFLQILAMVPVGMGLLIGTPESIIIGGIITVVCFILIGLISSATNTIITAALYEYAEGRPPGSFDKNLLEQAFTRR